MFDLLNISQFNDNIRFRWRNLNINDLMLINLLISLITKRFLRPFDRHSDKTVALSELLPNNNDLRNKILNVIRKSHECSFKIIRFITISSRISLIFFYMPACDVRALPADTRCRHDLLPSCC